MFGEGHGDSIVRRGIDEVLACRDLVEAAPTQATLLERLLSRIVSARWPIAPATPGDQKALLPARSAGSSYDK